METLRTLTEAQTRRVLGMSPEEFEVIKSPGPSQLHDPFAYSDMDVLIRHLHDFRSRQWKDPKLLLVIDPDYDTDGVMSAAVLSAALSVFRFNYRVYVPSMAEGYGLSPDVVDNMKDLYEVDGQTIGMILTADNGITAFDGIAYAKACGIPVLVTDHHPSRTTLPDAEACVNPNRIGDDYPFKGNAGACVAWKTMLAFAKRYAPESEKLIQQLIIFAGIANVADVMPILDENRYIVKAAVEGVTNLLKKQEKFTGHNYDCIMDTPYAGYNTVFHGLYDMLTLLQASKDEARAEQGKKPILLPTNEELFGWYLSPMLNAPRRVHESSLEAMIPFIVSDPNVRRFGIRSLIALNKEKTLLRDHALEHIEAANVPIHGDGIALCVNTRGGISGLIAGQLANQTDLPAIVFAFDDRSDSTVVYDTPPQHAERIVASARSNNLYPLNIIASLIEEAHPGILNWGGHAAAAGFNIEAKDYATFKAAFHRAVPQARAIVEETCEVRVTPENRITVDITRPNRIFADYHILLGDDLLVQEHELERSGFRRSILDTIEFQENLRPFGKDFNGCTKFRLRFDHQIQGMDWNPDFWKTFKFNIEGVEVLTFDPSWADAVKGSLASGRPIEAIAELKINEFRGRITPQLVLSPHK